MPIYVSLLRFTEKGIHHVKDTVKRSEDFRRRAKKHGVTVKETIWTQGAHDIVTIFEAPDETVPAGTVSQVVQSGWTIGDRVLRPAMVGVSKGGPKAAPRQEPASSDE